MSCYTSKGDFVLLLYVGARLCGRSAEKIDDLIGKSGLNICKWFYKKETQWVISDLFQNASIGPKSQQIQKKKKIKNKSDNNFTCQN